tara:strand:+ start:2388 stop:3755 length:1368 start_codon:yes stop_codon:yes gene_type:complete
MQNKKINWEGFKSEISGVRFEEGKDFVTSRSKDYFWYSPILSEILDDKIGDLVVIPSNQEEIIKVVSAIAKYKIPLTLRGGGTGNYGQCVPLEGGVIMIMTKLDKIIKFNKNSVRTEAGIRISRLDDAARKIGLELLMYPSTRQTATIGGFLAGGSGGCGSLRNGMLRDPGNISYLKVLTVEKEPKIIELYNDEIQKVQHAYGTNGIVLEIELALSKAKDWIHCAVLLDGYNKALDFAIAAQKKSLDCYLLTVVERRFSQFYEKLKDRFPNNRDAVFSMVAPEAFDDFKKFAETHKGTISFSFKEQELRPNGLQPAYEFGWNHTTLQALKVDKSWTYLQVAYPQPFDPNLVMKQMKRYGDDIYWHHEMARMGGHVQIFALPLVKSNGRDHMYKLIEELEKKDYCTIYDPHVYTIEDGGMKEIDNNQIEFKKKADPYGLMNPGKTSGWSPGMAKQN